MLNHEAAVSRSNDRLCAVRYVQQQQQQYLLRLLHRSLEGDGANLNYDARESSDKDFGHVAEWHMNG